MWARYLCGIARSDKRQVCWRDDRECQKETLLEQARKLAESGTAKCNANLVLYVCNCATGGRKERGDNWAIAIGKLVCNNHRVLSYSQCTTHCLD